MLERRHVSRRSCLQPRSLPWLQVLRFALCCFTPPSEIIRDLDLPAPRFWKFSPSTAPSHRCRVDDYLWRVNDHGKTHREIARHSRVDAEAYDEFGKAMQAMCRFVKPILSMIPPDPSTLNPRELMKLLFIGRRFQGMSSEDKYNQVQP